MGKADGEKLGLDVDFTPDGKVMNVRRVIGGLAERWNDVYPEARIDAGDVIVEVNGARDSVALLAERFRDDRVLQIKLRRTLLCPPDRGGRPLYCVQMQPHPCRCFES